MCDYFFHSIFCQSDNAENWYKMYVFLISEEIWHTIINSVEVSGCVPERIQKNLVWNRTAQLKGGANCNLELDLVNEFLNRNFKGMEIILLLCLLSHFV